MQTFKRGCVVLLVTLASACSGGNSTTTSPSPFLTRYAPTTTILLTGQVTDGTTSAPISGATVSFTLGGRTTTDSLGNYSVTGSLEAQYNVTYVSANNYASDYRIIRATSQNFHLHRIVRITAGDSTTVTVAPDDTLCSNNLQDDAFSSNHVCRSVRVVAPSDGVMTLEAVSTQGGAHPPLEVETVGVSPCCSERMGNPTSIPVRAGTEVVANVEMVLGSTTSQSFTLNTSMAPK